MLNRIYKLINNKFSKFFKFIFFLRYLFAIFFISIILFLSIPKFFDYKKKEPAIKALLLKNYGLNIKKIESIKYNSFPTPNLEISNLHLNFGSEDFILNTKILRIYPRLISIYNYENFEERKIQLFKNNIIVEFNTLNSFFKTILTMKRKIYLEDLNVKVSEKNNEIVNLQNIDFSNYGYKKNIMEGKIFDKKFRINSNDDLNRINLKLLNTGIKVKLNIFDKDEISKLKGNLKGRILKSNLKLDFIYEDNDLKIENFLFRNKNLSFNSKGYLKSKPFFYFNLNSEINNFNLHKIYDFDLNELLIHKNLIKKINTDSSFNFNLKKFNQNFIDNLTINMSLAYGRLTISKLISLDESRMNCDINMNLLDEFPIINFHCSLLSKDKKVLLKKFKFNYKNKNESLKIITKGNINILNNKINFDSIKVNENYKASKEDLIFFKKSFEETLFDKSFLKIFDYSKLNKFLNEIL